MKKKQQTVTEPGAEAKLYIGCLLEEFRQMFKAMQEEKDALRAMWRRELDEKFEPLKSKVDVLAVSVTELVADVNDLKLGQKRLEQGQTELRHDVAVLKHDVADLKQGVARLDQGQSVIQQQLRELVQTANRHDAEIVELRASRRPAHR